MSVRDKIILSRPCADNTNVCEIIITISLLPWPVGDARARRRGIPSDSRAFQCVRRARLAVGPSLSYRIFVIIVRVKSVWFTSVPPAVLRLSTSRKRRYDQIPSLSSSVRPGSYAVGGTCFEICDFLLLF